MSNNKPIEIPDYSAEQYINSSAPYEWLYQYKDDKFMLRQLCERMKSQAGAVGVKAFMSLWSAYCESQAEKRGFALDNATNFEGQTLELFSGNYICDEMGVGVIDRFGYEQVVCRHPIMPCERLVNIDSGEERLRIAYKKGRQWREMIAEKATIASSSSILQLSANGVLVNSDNAKALSTYLLELEQLNYDYIPEQKSVGRLGWVGKHGFSPYVEDLVFDGENNFKHIFTAVRPFGDRNVWVDTIKKVRAEKGTARFFLAASFASVILEPCGLLPFFLHAWGGTESGKAQPLDTKIITPNGFKLMGDIHIGDLVIGGDGKPYKVSGVYPQGKKDVYKITFSDGTSTRCCKEHLWNVTTRTRRRHNRGYITMSLEDILKKPIKTKKGEYQYRIPVCKPVEYEQSQELYIPPYALGALLGDGCLTLKRNKANYNRNIYFANAERDVVERLNDNLKENDVEFVEFNNVPYQHLMRGSGKSKFIAEIERLGLKCYSIEKFIPHEYLTSSISNRKALLFGLMDTDGSVGNKKHHYKYSTISEQLAKDVQCLCRSLGYRATISSNTRMSRFNPEGEDFTEFVVSIITDDVIFSSNKHAARSATVQRNRKEDKTSLAIVSVELVGHEECQCIMVDSEEHTYLCDDFIVTHNTVGLMIAASVWASPKLGDFITTFNSTSVGQEMTATFLNSLPMCIDELQIQTSAGVKEFDKIIYQLTEGVGRTRGAKTGGLQKVNTWRNCMISNGEQPISSSNSGGGAVNRIIEFECSEKVYSDLVGLCAVINKNYGWAGAELIRWLQKDGSFARINELQKEYYHELLKVDSTDKQAASASAILAADHIVTELIFQDGNNLTVEDMAAIMTKKSDVNVNERAYEAIIEMVSSNINCFVKNEFGEYKGEVWGKLEKDYVYIIKSIFDREMQNRGYNPTAFLSWAKANELLICGKSKNTCTARIVGPVTRCVCIKKTNEKWEKWNGQDPEF